MRTPLLGPTKADRRMAALEATTSKAHRRVALGVLICVLGAAVLVGVVFAVRATPSAALAPHSGKSAAATPLGIPIVKVVGSTVHATVPGSGKGVRWIASLDAALTAGSLPRPGDRVTDINDHQVWTGVDVGAHTLYTAPVAGTGRVGDAGIASTPFHVYGFEGVWQSPSTRALAIDGDLALYSCDGANPSSSQGVIQPGSGLARFDSGVAVALPLMSGSDVTAGVYATPSTTTPVTFTRTSGDFPSTLADLVALLCPAP